jgi:hypothetical protein
MVVTPIPAVTSACLTMGSLLVQAMYGLRPALSHASTNSRRQFSQPSIQSEFAVAFQGLAGFEAEQVHRVVVQVGGTDVVRCRVVVAEDDGDVDLAGPQQVERRGWASVGRSSMPGCSRRRVTAACGTRVASVDWKPATRTRPVCSTGTTNGGKYFVQRLDGTGFRELPYTKDGFNATPAIAGRFSLGTVKTSRGYVWYVWDLVDDKSGKRSRHDYRLARRRERDVQRVRRLDLPVACGRRLGPCTRPGCYRLNGA